MLSLITCLPTTKISLRILRLKLFKTLCLQTHILLYCAMEAVGEEQEQEEQEEEEEEEEEEEKRVVAQRLEGHINKSQR